MLAKNIYYSLGVLVMFSAVVLSTISASTPTPSNVVQMQNCENISYDIKVPVNDHRSYPCEYDLLIEDNHYVCKSTYENGSIATFFRIPENNVVDLKNNTIYYDVVVYTERTAYKTECSDIPVFDFVTDQETHRLDFSKFGECSFDGKYLTCDSKADGNADGICQRGESCVRYEMSGDRLIKTVKNSGETFVKDDETLRGIIQHNYTNFGDYTLTMNASESDNHFTQSSIAIEYASHKTQNLTILNSSETKRIFGFRILNEYISSQNYSWTLETGENNITSNQTIGLAPNEEGIIIIGYNYTTPGNYTITASSEDAFETRSDSLG